MYYLDFEDVNCDNILYFIEMCTRHEKFRSITDRPNLEDIALEPVPILFRPADLIESEGSYVVKSNVLLRIAISQTDSQVHKMSAFYNRLVD